MDKRKSRKYYLHHYWRSGLVMAAVWVLSLMPVPEVPQLADVPLWDKWTHMVMYGGLSATLWFDYWLAHRNGRWSWRRLWLWGWALPVLTGGLLEILQEYCTGGMRSGDWLDFCADAFGATVVSVAYWLFLVRLQGRRGRCS